MNTPLARSAPASAAPWPFSRRPRRVPLLAAICGGLLLLEAGGCYSFWGGPQQRHQASSVVGYLYPDETDPVPPAGLPVLRLPLHVGVAFVPSGSRRNPGYGSSDGPSEAQKTALLQRVADEFKGRDYIDQIEIVPSTYLRPGGSFANLNQVRRLLGVDVIALVAYDQVQFTDENLLSLSYWTIVGAYLFHGNKNDTQTLFEAAVYDIRSQHLLFRAPGASSVQGGSAAVYVNEHLRADSSKGFDLAVKDMIGNLTTQLEDFRTRVKQSPDTLAHIEHQPGYTGAGAFGGGFVALLACLALACQPWRKR